MIGSERMPGARRRGDGGGYTHEYLAEPLDPDWAELVRLGAGQPGLVECSPPASCRSLHACVNPSVCRFALAPNPCRPTDCRAYAATVISQVSQVAMKIRWPRPK